MYDNLEIRNGFMGKVKYNKEGEETGFKKIAKAIFLEQIFESVETGEITWLLKFDYLGKDKYIELPRKEIGDKKMVTVLSAIGADICIKNFDAVVNSLRIQESMFLSSCKSYRNIGWIRMWDERTQSFCWRYRCSKLVGGMKSKYLGNYSLTPKGSFECWKEMVEEEVLGNAGLETLLVASLASVVVGLIGEIISVENPIIHLNYDSGKGKSTVAVLAASVSGEAFDGKKITTDKNGIKKEYLSVYGSWGATERATITPHSGNCGVVAVLNELGKCTCRDMTSVIFNLSEGSDIKRLNTNLDTVLSEGFRTVFISCGEMSLIKKCKTKLEGIRSRVLEIEEAMTNDGAHARRIKDKCRKNYGFAAPMIAKYIVDHYSQEDVVEIYKKCLQELTENAPEGVADRFIEKFPAYFLTTARLAKEALGIEFDEKIIIEFCYKCWGTENKSHYGVCESYSCIIGECLQNEINFFHKAKNPMPRVTWGAVTYCDTQVDNKLVVAEYGLTRSALEALLSKHGYENLSTCVREWKAKGVLNYELGRSTRERMINDIGLKENLYVLRLFGNKEQEKDTDEKVKIKILQRRKELLEDDFSA